MIQIRSHDCPDCNPRVVLSLQVRTHRWFLFTSPGQDASSRHRSASSSSPSRVTRPIGCHGDQLAPPSRLWVWEKEVEENGRSKRRMEKQERLPHLLLKASLLVSCPSPISPRPLACAPQALTVPGNSVTKATRGVSSSITREITKTTNAATAATPWTAPPKATVTPTTSSTRGAAVTRGGRDKGERHQGRVGREEEGGEAEEGGTETEAFIIPTTNLISTTTTPTSTPTMHHSSPGTTLTTTACLALGSRLLHLRCCWGRGHHKRVGVLLPRRG